MRGIDETGSALFTVLVAAALGLVVAVTLTRLTSATGLLAKSAQLEGDVDRLERQIHGTLADAKSCPTMFIDASDSPVTLNLAAVLPIPVVAVDRLYSGLSAGGRTIAKVNASVTAAGLVVTEMDLREQYKLANLTSGLSNWELALRLRLEKKMTDPGGPSIPLPGSSVIIRKYRFSATVNAANQIVACAPLGSRTALGPMSPLRSTPSTIADCTNDASKDTACAALTPAARAGLPANPTQYFAATQGDALGFGMLKGTINYGAVPDAGPTPGFGLFGLGGRLYGRGGASSWALYDLLPGAAACTVLCIHKDAPIRFTRPTATIPADRVTSNLATSKDAFCKAQVGPKYIAATFNDLAQAGWSTTGTDPGGAPVEAFSATIGNYGGLVLFDAAGVGTRRVMYYDGTTTSTAYPLACVRRAQH